MCTEVLRKSRNPQNTNIERYRYVTLPDELGNVPLCVCNGETRNYAISGYHSDEPLRDAGHGIRYKKF
jgi:hypothetical protein